MQRLDRQKLFGSLLLTVMGLFLRCPVLATPAVTGPAHSAQSSQSTDEFLERIQSRFASGEAGSPEEQEKEFALLSDILQKDPNNSRAHYVLSLFLTNRGYEQLAIEELLKAVKLNPDYSDAHYRLCALYFKLQNLEAAERELAICSRLSAGDGAQLYRLALVVERFGEKRQAVPLYERAL
ncbi:MAG: tetratricopeptide repeat protein, partial [Cyanobacteria bacterium]|nr:tetratricopeptide repeat protein [Cyanobacteriota bacterium]